MAFVVSKNTCPSPAISKPSITRRAIYLVEGPHLSDDNPQNRRKIREMSAKMVARRAVKLSVIVGL
jgi:hypothetical protein